jgi:DNA-binding transcriptional LysR family regulator
MKALFFDIMLVVWLQEATVQWTDRIGRRIKLRDLHILLAVAQSGSMSRAADRLAISHPVVSKTITDLECALGVRLLDRTSTGTEPTTYGRALLSCGNIVFDELRRGVQEIAFLSDPTVGELRVGSAAPYIDGLVPAVITRLAQRYPQIHFRVTDTDAVSLCGMLRERKLDLVLGRVQSSVFSDDLTSEFLFEDCMHVVAGAKSTWAQRRRINLAELAGESWLMPESDNIAMALISEAYRSAGLTPPAPQVVSNSITLRARLIETGRFIAIMPDSVLRFGAGRLQIKILPVRLRMNAPPVVAISLKNRTPNPIARLFIDELRKYVKPQLNRGPRYA